jgi:type VI secretion system protein VasG
MDRIAARISRNHGVTLSYGDDVVKLIASRCTEPESGGRMIDAILTNTVLPQISREFLERLSQAHPTTQIAIAVAGGELNYQFG